MNGSATISAPPVKATEVVEAGGGGFHSEKAKKAERKLQAHTWDVDSWNVLLRETQNQRIQKARKTYERLVDKFPTCGRYWKVFNLLFKILRNIIIINSIK